MNFIQILLRKLSICHNNDTKGDYKLNEYEATHIFAHFVKKIGTDLCIFMYFILRLLKKITVFFGGGGNIQTYKNN